jgi:hypothetical protein
MSFCLSWDNHKIVQHEKNIAILETCLSEDNSVTDFTEALDVINTYNVALHRNLKNKQQQNRPKQSKSLQHKQQQPPPLPQNHVNLRQTANKHTPDTLNVKRSPRFYMRFHHLRLTN